MFRPIKMEDLNALKSVVDITRYLLVQNRDID